MMTFVKNQWVAKRKERKGFTLLEMLLVVFISAALLLLVLPGLIKQQTSVTEKTDEAFVTTVQNQVTVYASDNNGTFPENSDALKGGYLSTKQTEKANDKLKLDKKTGEVSLRTDSSSGNEQG